MEFIHQLLDVKGLIEWGGLLAICIIVFVETGLFVGFFLPGDSLLITAGIVAATGSLNLMTLLIFVPLCAIIGDQVGYYIGHKMGLYLFSKPDSFLFKREHLIKTQLFYAKHGPKTIVLARFVPLIRTFAPAVAGAAGMDYKKFVFYNIFGGLLWTLLTLLAGYFVGSAIPNVEKYLHVVIGIVILLSFVPIILEIQKNKKQIKPSQKIL